MTEAASEQELTASIGDELSSFIRHIDSLSSTLTLTMMVIRASEKLARDKFKEFSDHYTISSTEVNGEVEVEKDNVRHSVLVESTHIGEFKKLQRRISNTNIAYKTVPISFLVSLISQYDAFLGRLLRFIFLVKPEVLNTSDKNLSFSDLVSFGSIDNAREYIIEKEVEGVLRKSHTGQFDHLEEKFKIPLRIRSWCVAYIYRDYRTQKSICPYRWRNI